jgi:hypothetical protein
MTSDLDVICILSVPITGIAAIGAASARHFVLGDSELVRLAGADHELAFAAVGDLAGDGVVEEAMLEAFDDKPFKTVERVADLSALGALERGADFASAIVQ